MVVVEFRSQESQVAKGDLGTYKTAVVATIGQICAEMGKTECVSEVKDKQKKTTPQREGQSGAVSSMVT